MKEGLQVKEQIQNENAPAAIGPYSQAVKWGKLVFVSGQIALNSETGEVQGDIKEQTQAVLANLSNILRSANTGLDHVLKITVFLADINDFAPMNEIYSTFFNEIPPARSAFEVANLPKGAKVEIEAIAALD
jgi:2-iminobutanoate/2-iminopropanoate deaminase